MSKLTEVSLLADRAIEALFAEDRKSYVLLEKQAQERFPEHVQLFYMLIAQSTNLYRF